MIFLAQDVVGEKRQNNRADFVLLNALRSRCLEIAEFFGDFKRTGGILRVRARC